MTKVLFPDVSVVVHTEDILQKAKILHPGEYIALDDLPDYQRETALAGKIPGVRVIDKDAADLLLSEVERARNLVIPGEEETQIEIAPAVIKDDVTQEPELV